MKILALILIKLRNFIWEIRRRYDGDAFETERTDDYCGELLIPKVYDTIESDICALFYTIRTTCLDYKGKFIFPEKDCVLQYEEKDQLCSFHYYLDDKYQLHVRLFKDTKSFDRFLSVYAHTEIRPDFNPLAHIKGLEMGSGCELWNKLKQSFSPK